MWIVRIALTKPYTFIVMAILIFILGSVAIKRIPTDMFPHTNIPVVSVVYTYYGLSPIEMGERITFLFERQAPVTVSNIAYMESQSFYGTSVIKIYFYPEVDLGLAMAQITASAQTVLKYQPPGTLPPLIMNYDITSVPVMQLVGSSLELSEQEVFDLSNNFIRTQVAVVDGASIPFPYGGKWRQIRVDLDHEAMQMYKVTPEDINTALTQQNLIFPAGTQKIGSYEYYVTVNGQPMTLEEMNMLPVKNKNGAIFYMRDIGYVHDGYTPQTNIVRLNGVRAVMMPIQKISNVSTLKISSGVRKILSIIEGGLPSSLKLDLLNDQSFFVKAAIKNVLREILIAILLTGLLILLFIGSWKSTAIICISIPLAILSAVIILSLIGGTFNIMTLGGFALVVGLLVDDATVTLENINMNLDEGKDIMKAILDSANQIVLPLFVSLLCIVIVFIPMFFFTGIAKFLFTPFAEAVIFAMTSSFIISRTLVSTLSKYWLKREEKEIASKNKIIAFLSKIQQKFIIRFGQFKEWYHQILSVSLKEKRLFILIFFAFTMFSILLLMPWLGSNFFPEVDGGKFHLHLRAPIGTRVEETARYVDEVDNFIKTIIPENEIESILDNMGLPISGVNQTYSYADVAGPQDAYTLVSLKKGHKPTADYVRFLRKELPKKFPGLIFSFVSADLISEMLSFGLPAPINIKIVGLKLDKNFEYAKTIAEKIKHIPGIVDVHIQQAFNYPKFSIDVDRSLALELGVTEYDAATSAILAFSGSFQLFPTFWLDYGNTISYPLVIQTPQYRLTNIQQMQNIPLSSQAQHAQIIGAIATFNRQGAEVVQSHYNSYPLVDIYANIQDRDLGGVTHDIEKIIDNTKNELPKGSYVLTKGQIELHKKSFTSLYWGLLLAILFIYFVIVINFQSWADPFIIISALPAAIAGMMWMLFVTGMTLSVPALIGIIMCMGVATSNSILVVNFSRKEMEGGANAMEAALTGATTRLRPVLMTALAMIVGMLPIALGFGEAGEQNAPLGRTVIGGLVFATVATLVFVPCMFAYIHEKDKK